MVMNTALKQKKNPVFGQEHQRTVFALVFFGIVISGMIVIMLLRFLSRDQVVTPIGTIGGLEITREELLLYAEEYRAPVAKYFADTYGAKVDQDFWSASFGEEVPSELVKEKALEELKITKTEQKLMLEHGIIQDAGYEQFLQELSAENQSRKRTVSAGGDLYGPEEYGEKDFFLLIHEKRRNNLIKELAKTAFQITDADKQEFYQRAKQEKAAFLLDNGKYRSYDSVEPLLEKIIADQRYQKYLDQELKTTVVQITDKQYRKIIIQ